MPSLLERFVLQLLVSAFYFSTFLSFCRRSQVQSSAFRVTFLSLTLLVGWYRFSVNPEPLNP